MRSSCSPRIGQASYESTKFSCAVRRSQWPKDENPDEPETPEAPAFAIDPDVTLDSVVRIGDGPQVLSADIKFYPNTRRASSGDTVYWTLEIDANVDLVPPLSLVPELITTLTARTV